MSKLVKGLGHKDVKWFRYGRLAEVDRMKSVRGGLETRWGGISEGKPEG